MIALSVLQAKLLLPPTWTLSEAKLDITGNATAAKKKKYAKLRDAYNGGVVFLARLKLGPLSEKPAPGLALSVKTTPAPDKGGRKAQREAMNPHEISQKAAVGQCTGAQGLQKRQ
eukprot:627775-Pleurochrysis_carterae.AAC.1